MKQDNLFEAMELNETIGEKILFMIEEGIHKEIGFKDFCYLIRKDEKQIRDALNANNKYFSVTWLPIFFQRAPLASFKLIALSCDIANLEHPEPKKELTPEEELELYKKRIIDHGLQSLFKDLK